MAADCSGVSATFSMLCGVVAALLAFDPRRTVACLTVPSDIRFLEGERTAFCSFGMSSAVVDEHMEDMAVLVADSNELYRLQSPLASTSQASFCGFDSGLFRSKRSLPVDERLDSSSSRRMG